MQEDFDKIRLDHILIINELIMEYHAKSGHYPFENQAKDKPIVVIIGTEDQITRDNHRAPIIIDKDTRNIDDTHQPSGIQKITVENFTQELEAVLKKSIKLPVDPQNVPVNKASLYIYIYYSGVYDITGFLHHELPFTRNLSPFNNKVTVGNRTWPRSSIWTAKDLTSQPAFIKFFKSPFNKGGYTIKTKIK